MKNIEIIKQNGEKSLFEREKLSNSLKNSGASNSIVKNITTEIESKLYSGINTKEIYKMAFYLLKKHASVIASRYKLKKAIMELGPTGYPFEKFIGELLKNQGYKVEVGVTVQGNCVQHEVDVVAEKKDHQYMIECKFHGSENTICNVKVPLYIHSRYIDIKKHIEKQPKNHFKFHQGWVVTNTRFSSDAIQFGECVGLKLLSWDYPKDRSLKERISISGLYPITCLTTLTKAEKNLLLDQDIVLCKQLCSHQNILNKIGISQNRFQKILNDAQSLCETIN
jgi:hypothetical protein